MPLHHNNIDDFVTSVLDERLAKKSWVDISQTDQFNVFTEMMVNGPGNMKKGPGRDLDFEISGPQCKFTLQVKKNGSFRDSELFGIDAPTRTDLLTTGSEPWTMSTVNFSYDIYEEAFQGDDWQVIVDYLDVQNHAMYTEWFEKMDIRMWTAPASSSSEVRRPLGIPYWIQKSSTAAFGFNGGDPPGFSSGAAGISTSTYANWKNGTATYVTVSEDDLLKKWAKAYEFCDFKPPHKYKSVTEGKPTWGMYTAYPVLEDYQTLLGGANDNLGQDMGKYRKPDMAMFKGVPVEWVPAITHSTNEAYDSTNPIYGINWNTLCFKSRKDLFMKRSKPVQAPKQHTVRTVFVDSWGQFICVDRRRNFVIKAA